MAMNDHKDQSRVSPSTEELDTPLDYEFYLLKIFGHLVDYGLQECRLVCRKWYEVCQAFSLRLGVVPFGNLTSAARRFPNTISLTVETAAGEEETFRTARRLTAFPKLQSVKWTVRGPWTADPVWSILQPLHTLKRLELTIESLDKAAHVYSSLKCLTNLTELDVSGTGMKSFVSCDPFTNLKSIRSLRISVDLFLNRRGQCMFPALTNLTALVLPPSPRHNPSAGTFLAAIGSHARTLSTLSTSLPPVLSDADYAQLGSLKRLKTLEVFGGSNVTNVPFRNALKRMDSLEALSVKTLPGVKVRAAEFVNCFLSLSRLKSLGVEFNCAPRRVPLPAAAGLTQLTKLVLTVPGPVSDLLESLPRLQHLEAIIRCPWYLHDLNASLVSLSCLETLCISTDNGMKYFCLSSECLSVLKRLSALKLDAVAVDERFVAVLATLPDLRRLSIRSWSKTTTASRRDFFSKLSTMRSLKELELSFPEQPRVSCDIFPRHFSTLEKLTLGISKDQCRLIRRKLAVVPQLHVSIDPSR